VGAAAVIAYPSLIEPPSAFTVLGNEVLPEPLSDGLVFRMQLACTCGKYPYICAVVDDVAALKCVAFWQKLWQYMYEHEKAECQQEGREFTPDLAWEP
jgi:hypothetical protein